MTNSGSPYSTGWPFSTRMALITPRSVGFDLVQQLHRFDDAQRVAGLDGLADLDEGSAPGTPSGRRCRPSAPQCGFQRQFVALGAKTGDNADGDIRKIRMGAERLPPVDIRQMYLDEGDGHRRQGITQGNTGMGIGGRVDDNEADVLLAGRLHPVDQFAFMVALEAFEADTEGAGTGFHRLVDGGQGGTPVNLRFPGSQKVKVWPMEDQNGAVGIQGAAGFAALWLRHDCKFAANTRTLSSCVPGTLRLAVFLIGCVTPNPPVPAPVPSRSGDPAWSMPACPGGRTRR
jgi:hypothetical protein